MAQPKLVIEVRVNEYATRDTSPHVPYGPEEVAKSAVDCWRAGASVVHYHASDPETGAPSADVGIYAEVVRRIRQECDLITMPTLGAHIMPTPEGRVAHVVEMAKDPVTRPDFIPVDMLTTNMGMYDPERKEFEWADRVYSNTVDALRYLCETVRAVGVKPAAMMWNVAAVRLTEAFVEMGLYEEPLFCELPLFSDRLMAYGHPGTVKGMQALLEFFPPRANWVWVVNLVGVNSFPVLAGAIECGGHVALGIADYPYAELGFPTNAELVTRIVEMAHSMGREVATATEAREMLGVQSCSSQ